MGSRSVPGSPEMKFARNRLGDLLQGIRKHSVGLDSLDDRDVSDDDEDRMDDDGEFTPQFFQSSAARRQIFHDKNHMLPKKTRKEKKVLFELRGKPFELRDNQKEESLYRLCRVWVRGKEVAPRPLSPSPFPLQDEDNISIDLLATREIHSLPRPEDTEPMSRVPELAAELTPPDSVNLSSRSSILDSYMPRWKSIKRQWIEHSKQRGESRNSRSFGLLRTVHRIAQQNQLMA